MVDETCALDILDLNNLYINSLEKDRGRGGGGGVGGMGASDMMVDDVINDDLVRHSQVKKSASGDIDLRNLGASNTMDDDFKNFQNFQSYGGGTTTERGSRVSLNESPIPKHRKTRFQQSVQMKPIKARFEECRKASQESLDGSTVGGGAASTSGSTGGGAGGSICSASSGTKIKKRPSFMPSKSLASATKLINQHLFGIQSSGSKGKCHINTSCAWNSHESF